MQEEGLVVESEGLIAKVIISRDKNCGGCNICSPMKGVVRAINTIQAKVGEGVKLEINSFNVFKAGLLVYILPLLGLILGLSIGDYLFHLEVASLLSGLFGFTLTFLLVYLYDKKIRKRGEIPFRIIEVIKNEIGQ